MKITRSINRWFRANFGLTKHEWKKYFLFTIPIVLSSILYSSNGFIDNFMVTHLKNAVTALSYANAWVGILFSLLIGINIVGNMLYGQFRGMNDKKHIKESTRARFFLSISASLILFIACQISPEFFINIFAGNTDVGGREKGVIYIRLISITWLLSGWTFVTANIMRELGAGKLVLISNIAMITTNVLLNIFFIYILNLGVAGAAYATIISQVVYVIMGIIFLYKNYRSYLVNFVFFWKIDKIIWKLYFKRWITILISSFSIIFVTIRGAFWNRGFPEGSIINENWAIGGAVVLSITISITNILTSAFPSVGATVAMFVGRHLGRSEKTIAIANAYKLRGFNFVLALGLSVIFLIFVSFFHEISYFSKGVENKVFDILISKGSDKVEAAQEASMAASEYLKQIQYTLIPIIFFNPFWIWMITTTRIFSSGGRTNTIFIMDFLLNFLHLTFLIFLIYVITPWAHSFLNPVAILPVISLLFFSFEIIIKIPLFEFMIQKVKWANKIKNY